MNTSSLNRRLDKLEAMIPVNSSMGSSSIDMSLFSEEEQAQFRDILGSIPDNGSLRDVSDEQLIVLHRLALVYKERCEATA
jgi:hypothetical protein